jgi:hypothetical protein
MTYEEFFYRSLTEQELKRTITDGGLNAYGKRCQQELDRRHQEQNEITSL